MNQTAAEREAHPFDERCASRQYWIDRRCEQLPIRESRTTVVSSYHPLEALPLSMYFQLLSFIDQPAVKTHARNAESIAQSAEFCGVMLDGSIQRPTP
jgi:hypothetical protein